MVYNIAFGFLHVQHKENRIVGDHLRQYIEDLLVEYKVDLTLAGEGEKE